MSTCGAGGSGPSAAPKPKWEGHRPSPSKSRSKGSRSSQVLRPGVRPRPGLIILHLLQTGRDPGTRTVGPRRRLGGAWLVPALPLPASPPAPGVSQVASTAGNRGAAPGISRQRCGEQGCSPPRLPGSQRCGEWGCSKSDSSLPTRGRRCPNSTQTEVDSLGSGHVLEAEKTPGALGPGRCPSFPVTAHAFHNQRVIFGTRGLEH